MAGFQTGSGALGLPQGINPYLVRVPIFDLDYDKAPTAEETRHGLMILGGVEPGKVYPLGRTQEWDPSAGISERTVTYIREIGVPETEGAPVGLVPGDMGDPSITIARIELFKGRFEQALGLSDKGFRTVMDQKRPFFLVERKTRGPSKTIYEELLYNGCIFTAIPKSGASVGGDKHIIVNATIAYVNVVRFKAA